MLQRSSWSQSSQSSCQSGRPLRLKMGFDPSAPDIHIGHAVGLRKLRQLQELGHKVVLIVGDWTAQIGDPSGVSQTRPILTSEEVLQNAETYISQFFKIVDRDRTETRWQSEWFGSFSLTEVIRAYKPVHCGTDAGPGRLLQAVQGQPAHYDH